MTSVDQDWQMFLWRWWYPFLLVWCYTEVPDLTFLVPKIILENFRCRLVRRSLIKLTDLNRSASLQNVLSHIGLIYLLNVCDSHFKTKQLIALLFLLVLQLITWKHVLIVNQELSAVFCKNYLKVMPWSWYSLLSRGYKWKLERLSNLPKITGFTWQSLDSNSGNLT